MNSAKSLKTIGQQRISNSYSNREEFVGSNKFMTNAFKLETANKKDGSGTRKSSRQHFHKSFSLLVNLGGRVPSVSFDSDAHDEEGDDLQVILFYLHTVYI